MPDEKNKLDVERLFLSLGSNLQFLKNNPMKAKNQGSPDSQGNRFCIIKVTEQIMTASSLHLKTDIMRATIAAPIVWQNLYGTRGYRAGTLATAAID